MIDTEKTKVDLRFRTMKPQATPSLGRRLVPVVRIAVDCRNWPAVDRLRTLADKVIEAAWTELDLPSAESSEVSILFTNDAGMRRLNAAWLGKDKPTNVLSFPSTMTVDPGRWPRTLGDIALAYETVSGEARLENKPFDHHLSHMIVHGLLHLLGYDHQSDDEANQMEQLETRILTRISIPDPYAPV